jgi:hypothetical protein
MATTTNYGWTTPDDTDLVKDGAAAIRTLGSSIDTSFVADEGDLLVGGTSDIFEALPIGAAGTVLTSDGDTAEWVAPAGGGQDFTLLNSGGTALTGASTITVSGISGKNTIHVIIFDASSASAESIIRFRLNADSGANYSFAGMQLEANGVNNTSLNTVGTTGAAQIPIANMSTSASSIVNGGFTVSGANSSGVKTIYSTGSGSISGASFNTGTSFQGIYTGSSTISSISILSSIGNFDGGTVFVYVSE